MKSISTHEVSCRQPSSNSLVSTSDNAVALVSVLNSASSGQFTFTISTRILDRQNSPELTKIKKLVDALPGVEFQTLSNVGMHLQQSNSRIEEFRRKLILNRTLIKNEPKYKQVEEVRKISLWIDEERDRFGAGGDQCIKRYVQQIDEDIFKTQEEAEKVQLRLRAIYILRDNTEYWQGFWDAIKDKLLPDASAVQGTPVDPIPALVVWVADLIVSGIIYDKSWEREKFLEALDAWEHMLTEDHKMLLETEGELEKYAAPMVKARGYWEAEVGIIWLKVDKGNDNRSSAMVQYDTHLRGLEVSGSLLSLTLKPFKDALCESYPFYGAGISVQRNARDFCKNVPYALDRLKKLLTAKGMMPTSQQEAFQAKVYSLAKLIYGHLKDIERLCAAWSKSMDPQALAEFLQAKTPAFLTKTDRVIQAIKNMLETEVRDNKKAQVLKNRMDGDRHHRSWLWKDRPLVESSGALEVLEELEDIILNVIYRFSVCAGSGTNMSAVEGIIEAQRSYPDYNHSNSLLQEFFKVLGEEILRGSLAFPEREKAKTGTKSSRAGWRSWFKGKKQEQVVSISGL